MYITQQSPEYPAALLRMENPPKGLHLYGDAGLLKRNMVAVVGNRDASFAACHRAHHIAKALIEHNYVVISGLADGIDSIAHHACVEHGGSTIAVLGCGIDYRLPAKRAKLCRQIIEQGGLVITEYAANKYPNRERLMRRNEIMAALAKLVIPIQCVKMRSGTGAMIRRAERLGTPVVSFSHLNESDSKLHETRQTLMHYGIPYITFQPGEGREAVTRCLTRLEGNRG